jgi:hypothetical protein
MASGDSNDYIKYLKETPREALTKRERKNLDKIVALETLRAVGIEPAQEAVASMTQRMSRRAQKHKSVKGNILRKTAKAMKMISLPTNAIFAKMNRSTVNRLKENAATKPNAAAMLYNYKQYQARRSKVIAAKKAITQGKVARFSKVKSARRSSAAATSKSRRQSRAAELTRRRHQFQKQKLQKQKLSAISENEGRENSPVTNALRGVMTRMPKGWAVNAKNTV